MKVGGWEDAERISEDFDASVGRDDHNVVIYEEVRVVVVLVLPCYQQSAPIR
jgi:hypothetical protein